MNLKARLSRYALRATIAVLLLGGSSACALPQAALPSPPPTVLPTVQPSPTTPPIEVLDPDGCELHLWHSLTGQKEATLRDLAAKFEEANPNGIRVRVEFHSPLHSEVLAAIYAGTPPDVVIAPCDRIAEYAALDAVVPLTQYVESKKYGLFKADLADLWPIALNGCSGWQGQGRLGLFFDVEAEVMLYNTGWLERLEAEAPPETWEGFRELCNAARNEKAPTWGYVHANRGLTLVNWISGLGGVLLDKRTGQVTLDDPRAIAAVSLLRDLLQDDCAYCAEPGADRADFAAEKALFTFASTADLAKYAEAVFNAKTKKAKFEWSIAPVPGLLSQPVVSVQGSTMSILRTTPRQQLAAWLFLRWFTWPESDVQWALSTGALPLHKSSAEADEMSALFEQTPQYQAACELLAFAQSEPVIPIWQQVRALLVDAAASVCSGQAEPPDALAAADAAADLLLTR